MAHELKEAVRALMQGFSVEITPGELARLKALPAELPAGSRVYLPWVAGNRFETTLRAAATLRAWGMTPVPHLAARAIEDVATLDAMLAELVREARVDQIMLIAGSQRVPVGVFDSSVQVLHSGLVAKHHLAGVALGAHPEGSPDIPPAALDWSLRAKNEFAAQAPHVGTKPMACQLVTQFCFEPQPLLAWERRARAAGNHLPVRIGLAGLASVPTLIRYARSCGVGPSMQVLMGQGLRMMRLAGKVAPGPIVAAAAQARRDDTACLLTGCHFFPFGALEPTVAWAAAIARGDFNLSDSPHGASPDLVV